MLAFTVSQAQISQIGSSINGKSSNSWSGFSVSLSANGKRVAIGSPTERTSGYIQIFEETSRTWSQIGNEIEGSLPEDISSLASGYTVSLNGDGKVVAFGTPRFNNDNGSAGRVRIYREELDNWVKVGDDIEGTAKGERLGESISLSLDGNTIAIGIPGNDENGSNSGKVKVYRNISGIWTQVGNDILGEAIDERLGETVSLSSDESTLVIGAPEYDNELGRVYIYGFISGIWTKIGNSIQGNYSRGRFGDSVSINSDGKIIGIGAPYHKNSGLVRLYNYVSGSWQQIGEDINGKFSSMFGNSISLNDAGDIVAVGAPEGITRVYKRSSNVWGQIGGDLIGEREDDNFGWAVNLSSNGNVLAIGAPHNDGNGSDSGQVRIYEIENNNLGIEESNTNLKTIGIFPNPVENVLNILTTNKIFKKVEIFDTKNSLISTIKMNFFSKKIDVSHLDMGIYLFKFITNDRKVINKRIIKKSTFK